MILFSHFRALGIVFLLVVPLPIPAMYSSALRTPEFPFLKDKVENVAIYRYIGTDRGIVTPLILTTKVDLIWTIAAAAHNCWAVEAYRITIQTEWKNEESGIEKAQSSLNEQCKKANELLTSRIGTLEEGESVFGAMDRLIIPKRTLNESSTIRKVGIQKRLVGTLLTGLLVVLSAWPVLQQVVHDLSYSTENQNLAKYEARLELISKSIQAEISTYESNYMTVEDFDEERRAIRNLYNSKHGHIGIFESCKSSLRQLDHLNNDLTVLFQKKLPLNLFNAGTLSKKLAELKEGAERSGIDLGITSPYQVN